MTVDKSYLVFGAPRIGAAEIAEVLDSLQSGWIGSGPKVARFEEAIRAYVGTRHAVAVNSCTAALHLALRVAGIGPGDEVITTAMTFPATANAILHAGATPVLVDCDRATMSIDPERVKDAVTPRTRALIPVHMAGRPAPMAELDQIARRFDLIMIEDAAHALEARYRGRKIGALGQLACFSFYATKNITTGEGGMVTTDSPEYARKLRMYALHGLSQDAWKRYSDAGFKHYEVVLPGYKHNLTDVQAAIGIHQLAQVEKWLERRRQIWQRYDAAFAELPVGRPAPEESDTVHARHLYTLMIDAESCGISRDQFIDALHGHGIGTGVHYRGVHLHQYYREAFGYRPENFPNATWISDRTVSLPLSPHLSDQDAERVIAAVIAAI